MSKISGWIQFDGCSMRTLLGADPADVSKRVALIVKTPRVRIRPAHFRINSGYYEDGGQYTTEEWKEHLDWCERDWSGSGPDDVESMAWCDSVLKALGFYEFPENQ